jgi:hypothetical protein
MTTSPELLAIILSEFQDVLRENQKQEWQATDGHAPKYGYVEQTEWTPDECHRTPPIAAWHISAHTVRPCAVKQPANPTITGMFFDLLHGRSLFRTMLHRCTSLQTGPLWQGFVHRSLDLLGRPLISRCIRPDSTPNVA